jgi:GDP-4-dehydro-6-deoxy-D-mannose reductase
LRVLITGGSGFVARHLAELGLARGATVFAATRGGATPDGVTALTTDLSRLESATAAVRESLPDLVFHLAAQTPANSPNASVDDSLLTNQRLALHLLEAVRSAAPTARVLLVSSSAVYGHVPDHQLPIAESAPLQPTTLYGVSKAAVELLGIRYAMEHALDVQRARPFNLIGPGEPDSMLTTTLAAQVAQIANGRGPAIIRVRHRDTARDYTDVRDAVRAYWSILERGRHNDVYNVCSGVAVPVGQLITKLLQIAGLSAAVQETEGHAATGDIRMQAGDSSALKTATAWMPSIDLDRSLEDLLRSVSSPMR